MRGLIFVLVAADDPGRHEHLPAAGGAPCGHVAGLGWRGGFQSSFPGDTPDSNSHSPQGPHTGVVPQTACHLQLRVTAGPKLSQLAYLRAGQVWQQ